MKLIQGDCLEVMKALPDNSVDSCVTDPPYGLKFMGKKWDYDVPTVEQWEEVYRVMKPGAFLLSFWRYEDISPDGSQYRRCGI